MDVQGQRPAARRLLFAGFVAIAVIVVLGRQLVSFESDERPVELAAPNEVYDPVKAGEPLPSGFRQVVDRDQILPVYEPVFTSASQVDWPSDMLVIGVAGSKEAKAYPVAQLNRREMVIDSLEGIPILVTW
jgi:hypothetical protein